MEETRLLRQQDLVTIALYPLSHHILLGGERIGNPPCHVSCLPDRPVPGKVLILLNLLASSWSSVTKRRSSSPWVHLPQVCSPLPSPAA